MQKSEQRRWLLSVIACAMLGFIAIFGFFSYFSSSDAVTNRLTAGRIRIDLLEPNYAGNGSSQTKLLVPNQPVPKDPKVVNTGEIDVVVFMELKVPAAASLITVDDEGKNKKIDYEAEVFELFQNDVLVNGAEKIPATSENGQWLLLNKTDFTVTNGGTHGQITYLYGWTEILIPEEKSNDINDGVGIGNSPETTGSVTAPLFDKTKLKNIISSSFTETQDIIINTYAIQAREVAVHDGQKHILDKEKLTEIWENYFTNGNAVLKEASYSNKYSIPYSQ